MSDLKPCPFCGGKAVLRDLSDEDGGWFFVFCVKGCSEQTVAYKTAEEAAEAWNRRVQE